MTASSASAVLGGTSALWVSGNTYRVNDVSRSPTDWQLYVRIIAGAGTTDPASDSTNWRPSGGRPRKPVQRGFISLGVGVSSNTATISAVNTAKTELRNTGWSSGAAASISDGMAGVTLTNSTTITATRGGVSGSSSINVYWELTEFY